MDGTVRVGSDPVQAVLTPNGTTAYVLNTGAGTVSVVNTATNSVTATIKVGLLPGHAAVTPDGSSVYVTNTGSGSVSVISTATQSVVATSRWALRRSEWQSRPMECAPM